MTERPTRQTAAGRAYLDLRKLARVTGRPTDELLQLYALEGFLQRLQESPHAERLVLKGGVLLAAFDARRPTRDIDLAMSDLDNDADTVRAAILGVLQVDVADGLAFELSSPQVEVIREDDVYSGLRVTVAGQLASALLRFHVDVNIGDPVWPPPFAVSIPRLLDGKSVTVIGYPIVMVLAEKIVTAIQRGTANTRWRDFVDIAWLSRRHAIGGTELRGAMERVAQHRGTELTRLHVVLAGFGDIAQARWRAWRRKQSLSGGTPESFGDLLVEVLAFTEEPLTTLGFDRTWEPSAGAWL